MICVRNATIARAHLQRGEESIIVAYAVRTCPIRMEYIPRFILAVRSNLLLTLPATSSRGLGLDKMALFECATSACKCWRTMITTTTTIGAASHPCNLPHSLPTNWNPYKAPTLDHIPHSPLKLCCPTAMMPIPSRCRNLHTAECPPMP